MLKKFFIAVGSLFAVLVVACSNGGVEDVAGGTIDPSTIALNSCSSGDAGALSSSLSETENGVSVSEPSSSSSESDPKMVQDESSSSGNENNIKPIFRSSSSERPVIESSSDEGENKVVDPIPVSSSSELRDGGIAHASDFAIQCVEDVIYVKLDTPAAASDVSGPKAFKHVEGDSVKFVLQNVYFAIPCEEDAQKQFLQAETVLKTGCDSRTDVFCKSCGNCVIKLIGCNTDNCWSKQSHNLSCSRICKSLFQRASQSYQRLMAHVLYPIRLL